MIREVVDNLTLVLKKVGLDAINKRITAQALFNGLTNVEQCFVYGFAFCDNLYMMTPWDNGKNTWKFSNSLLEFLGS